MKYRTIFTISKKDNNPIKGIGDVFILKGCKWVVISYTYNSKTKMYKYKLGVK